MPDLDYEGASLEEKTSAFWNFSLRMNGRSGKSYTTGDVLQQLNVFSAHLGPQRVLAGRVETIRKDVIVGGKRKKRDAATVIQLKHAIN